MSARAFIRRYRIRAVKVTLLTGAIVLGLRAIWFVCLGQIYAGFIMASPTAAAVAALWTIFTRQDERQREALTGGET